MNKLPEKVNEKGVTNFVTLLLNFRFFRKRHLKKTCAESVRVRAREKERVRVRVSVRSWQIFF